MFQQKRQYSISCMIVNEHNHRITHLHASFSGLAHDSFVFANSKIWLHHADFFKCPVYILTDIGYPLNVNTMPPYKVPASKRKENQRFNKCLYSIRVRSKHTIGQLKGRFQIQSLRGIPTIISGKAMHTLVMLCIWGRAPRRWIRLFKLGRWNSRPQHDCFGWNSRGE